MKVRLSASGFELTSELEKYANTKVAQLNKKVPRKLRAEAACEVHFNQVQRGGAKFNTCSIGVAVDDTELKAEETTLHMYAALDIAAVHIGHQLDDYAVKLRGKGLRGRLKRRFHHD